MRKVNQILSIAFLLIALCCCEKKTIEQPIPDSIGSSSYLPIEFGVDIVNTRAQIVEGGENATLDRLGVIGYQYANQAGSNWNTAKSTTRPNVFANTPHGLTLADNYYNIDDNTDPNTGKPYSWSGNKYAFFAIYPLDHSYVVASASTEPNTPYVTYTVDRSNVANMADVMTSSHVNLTASSRYVTFHMTHRLSAVDVEVHNIYEHSYTEDEVTHYENIDIEIVDLLVQFSNLHYDSSKIYLDENEEINITNAGVTTTYTGQVPTKGANTTAEYHLVNEGTDNSIEIPFKTDEDADNYQLTADYAATMFFIPQEQDDLKVSVAIKFKKKRPDNTYLINNNYDYTYDENGNMTGQTQAKGFGSEFFYATKETAFEQSLDERYRYYVTLNFTSAAVSINIVTAAQWDEKDIDYEFD